jgi:hypothetical protein
MNWDPSSHGTIFSTIPSCYYRYQQFNFFFQIQSGRTMTQASERTRIGEVPF